jgi:ribosome maturation factor RimP
LKVGLIFAHFFYLKDIYPPHRRESSQVETVENTEKGEDRFEEIRKAIVSVLRSIELELFDLEYLGNSRQGILRVTIDKPGGVRLDDCERASRNIGPLLDVYDPIDHRYTLEVTSPGLDRPLRNLGEFNREIGKRVAIKTRNPIHSQKVFSGRLISVEENGNITILEEERNRSVQTTISYDNVLAANLEVEW